MVKRIVYKLLFLRDCSLIKDVAQTAVINIVFQLILMENFLYGGLFENYIYHNLRKPMARLVD